MSPKTHAFQVLTHGHRLTWASRWPSSYPMLPLLSTTQKRTGKVLALEEREATRDQHNSGRSEDQYYYAIPCHTMAYHTMPCHGKVVLHRFELVGSHDSIAR